MIKTTPKFVYDEHNKKQGVLLTMRDFELLMESLEDYYDYKIVKNCDMSLKRTVSFEEIERKYLDKK